MSHENYTDAESALECEPPAERDPEVRAWRRALDACTGEILSSICRFDVGDARIEHSPLAAGPDPIYLLYHADGRVDLVHIQIKFKKDDDFERDLLARWVDMYLDSPDTDGIHQIVILPTGAAGFTGEYTRNAVTLTYTVADIPSIPDWELLDGPLPSLALLVSHRSFELIDDVVERIAGIPDPEKRAAVTELGMSVGEPLRTQLGAATGCTELINPLVGTEIGDGLFQRGYARGVAKAQGEITAGLIESKFGSGTATPHLIKALRPLSYDEQFDLIEMNPTIDSLLAALT